jgi:hypothetical protein
MDLRLTHYYAFVIPGLVHLDVTSSFFTYIAAIFTSTNKITKLVGRVVCVVLQASSLTSFFSSRSCDSAEEENGVLCSL